MKTLLYVPVIHTSADLGSLAKEIAKRGSLSLGEEIWRKHRETVDGYWQVISDYFAFLNAEGVKIYQDGMVAEAEVGEKIVEEGIKQGSKNHQLVSKLISRGAILVKTEDFGLVKKEHDRLLAIAGAKSISRKIVAFMKYKLVKEKLLNERDEFIAKRIDQTLKHGEKGILFIGAYHKIKLRLSSSFLIKEIKDIEKIREYHKLLPFSKKDKNRKRFEELGSYLLSPVNSR